MCAQHYRRSVLTLDDTKNRVQLKVEQRLLLSASFSYCFTHVLNSEELKIRLHVFFWVLETILELESSHLSNIMGDE